MSKTFLFFLLALLTLSGCNFQKMKGAASLSAADDLQTAGLSASYAAINASILAPKCVSCHSSNGEKKGGAALDSYEVVRPLLARIAARSIDKKDMPPGQPLSPAELSLLSQWVKLGGPVQSRSAKPPPPSGIINWKYMRENVLTTCLQCHSSPDPEAGLDLTDSKKFRENVNNIFDRTIVKRLCPLPPLPAMTEDEQTLMMRWISQGMPE